MPDPGRRAAIAPAFAVLFVLSGAAGLIYEVVWSRLLAEVFGVTAFAVSTVLASFMGGLALGAALIGKRSARVLRPLRLFAVLEASIAAYALVLPTLLDVVNAAHTALLQRTGGTFLVHSAVRLVLCAGVLLVPTALMGATLPALGQGLLRNPERLGLGVGALYFVNTLGAGVGCYLAGFHLIPALGLRRTTLVAVALNGTVALGAWLLDRGSGVREAAPGPRPADEDAVALASPLSAPAPTAPPWWPLAVAFGSGALALLFEVVWFRVLILVFGSTVYSFSAMLSIFLVGLAVGSLIAASVADRARHPVRLLAAIQVGIALAALGGSLAVNRFPYLFLDVLGRLGADFAGVNRAKLILSLAVLFPPALGFGATFPVLVRLWRYGSLGTGPRIGGVYAWNTLGAILGSVGAGFVLVPWIGAEGSLALAVLGPMVLAVGTLLVERGPLDRRWVVGSGVLAVAVLAGVLGANRWDRKLLGIGVYYLPHSAIDWSDIRGSVNRAAAGFRLTGYFEGFGDTITSLETEDGKVITVNGSATASTDFTDMFSQRMMGHLPMALHPGVARKVCVIGLGAGVTAGSMALYRPEEMIVVELERGVLEASRFFDTENHRVLDDPAVRVVIDDGMIFLRATREEFDVISSHPNFPSLTGSGTLFSTEYFELCRARLAPGGIVCHYAPLWRTAPEDLMTILASFAEVFDHVRVFNTGLSLVLLGRVGPFPAVDVEELSRRVAQPEVAASLGEVGVRGPMDLLALYALDEQELRRLVGGAPLNTTDFPRVEYRAPRSVFSSTVGSNLELLRSAQPGLDASASRLGLSGEPRSPYVEEARAFRTTLDAEIAFSRNETDEAVAMLIPIAQSGRRYASYLLASRTEQLGRIALANGRLLDARELFEVAVHFDPGRRDGQAGLAYVESLLEELEERAPGPAEGGVAP